MASIGENIRRLRENNGWSQSELASKIGKTRSAISQYEHDETTPRIGVIEDLASAFGVKKSSIIEPHISYYTISTSDDLTNDEKILIEYFRQLPTKAKHALIAGLQDYISE